MKVNRATLDPYIRTITCKNLKILLHKNKNSKNNQDMKGIYYKTPMDFGAIMDQRDAEKVSIDKSINQHIFIIITTALGECKFDETYGTKVWELDFDLLKSDNSIKEFIGNAIKESITKHEKRFFLEDIEVTVRDTALGKAGGRRIKKKVIISIKGFVWETDRLFIFQKSFFIGPLSY